jgi:colicin import membrane protein
MGKAMSPYLSALAWALLLHVIVLVLLLSSFSPSAEIPIVHKTNKVVHAVAVNNSEVQKKVKQIRAEQQQKLAADAAREKHLKQQAADLAHKRLVEKKQLAKIKREQALAKKTLHSEEKRQQAEIATLKKERAQEAKQLAALQKKTLSAKKILKSEEDALKKQQLQQQKALALQKAIEAKEHDKEQQQSQAREGVVSKYKALILESISRHWYVPPGISKTASCQLTINLAPGGSVLDVQVLKSSGDPILDRSAVAAVFKASPLPVPNDSADFVAFKRFNLTVRPESFL